MAKLGFLPVLKQVCETHLESASVMVEACAAACNLARSNGRIFGCLKLDQCLNLLAGE